MPATLVESMAKKTAKNEASPAPNRKPMVVQIRGSEDYKAWVEEIAEAEGLPVSTLFDQALRHFVETKGKHRRPPIR